MPRSITKEKRKGKRSKHSPISPIPARGIRQVLKIFQWTKSMKNKHFSSCFWTKLSNLPMKIFLFPSYLFPLTILLHFPRAEDMNPKTNVEKKFFSQEKKMVFLHL
jgi:hypothetical protein